MFKIKLYSHYQMPTLFQDKLAPSDTFRITIEELRSIIECIKQFKKDYPDAWNERPAGPMRPLKSTGHLSCSDKLVVDTVAYLERWRDNFIPLANVFKSGGARLPALSFAVLPHEIDENIRAIYKDMNNIRDERQDWSRQQADGDKRREKNAKRMRAARASEAGKRLSDEEMYGKPEDNE
jgi:hypothetical protein